MKSSVYAYYFIYYLFFVIEDLGSIFRYILVEYKAHIPPDTAFTLVNNAGKKKKTNNMLSTCLKAQSHIETQLNSTVDTLTKTLGLVTLRVERLAFCQ